MSTKATKAFVILLPEVVVGPLVTLGAVYIMEQMPKQMNRLSGWVSDHIVSKHLTGAENLAKGIRKAHAEYDEKKNAQRIARGEPPIVAAPETPKERSFAISDGLVKTGLAIAADTVGTYAAQKALNAAMHTDINASKVSMIATAVHLGAMAAMPTLFPKQSENFHYWLSKKLQHNTKTSKENADERARALTYVSLPGYFASAATLLYALRGGAGKAR